MNTIAVPTSPAGNKLTALVRKILRYSVFPLFFALYFAGQLKPDAMGLALAFVLVFGAMWAFAKPGLAPWRYVLAACLTGFYFLLYFTNAFDVIAQALSLGTKWTFYGALYTLAILVFGVITIRRYRKSPYQRFRTLSLMSVQLLLAFVLPVLLPLLQQPEYYFSYFWPLKIEYFYPEVLRGFPLAIIFYSLLGSLVVFPVLGLVFGKRFYCSWVCGCGALAETAGDRTRTLSDKSEAAWKFEKVSIYSVLFLAIVMTGIIAADFFWNSGGKIVLLKEAASRLKDFYGYAVSFLLAGAVGVGFYPVLGARVWCRFFCPMAALLGIIQKAGRFHIRVKTDMCISCGLCSHNCEMGIDIRRYAQENRSFTRASCVGCGICSQVCPRGVLKLELKKDKK